MILFRTGAREVILPFIRNQFVQWNVDLYYSDDRQLPYNHAGTYRCLLFPTISYLSRSEGIFFNKSSAPTWEQTVPSLCQFCRMFLWIHFNSLHTKFRNFRWFNQTKNLSAQRNELKYREVICQSLIRQFKYQQIQMYLSFCQFTKYTVSSLEIFLHLSRFEWQTMVDCSVSGQIWYQIVFNYKYQNLLNFTP